MKRVGGNKMRAQPLQPRSHKIVIVCLRQLGLDEDNKQREQHQRLDQRQTQNHHRLNFAGRSRIPRGAFTGRSADARLAE